MERPMRKAKSLFHSANHAINYCARSIAKNAVKEELRSAGVRVTLVKPAEIAERAQRYLADHPELYTLALERARRMGWVEVQPIMVSPDLEI
jgi:NAD(P)-dependent dehydrogenase (short-subunit alcohol dehydrogenase family)